MLDAAQRTALFLDTLLDRGNNYIQHLDQGTPPLLKFEHELVLDGADLKPPCNYALLHLLPPPSMPLNPKARPVVVVDPRAGHGPGIGGGADWSGYDYLRVSLTNAGTVRTTAWVYLSA